MRFIRADFRHIEGDWYNEKSFEAGMREQRINCSRDCRPNLANSIERDAAVAQLKEAYAREKAYKTALETVIEAAFPQYKDDLDRFVSDLAVWKDSVARQESLERLNGLNAEHLERMFDIEDLEGDDGE